MSQFDQLIRLRTWQLDEKRRVLGELQRAAGALHQQRRDLDDELAREKTMAAGSVDALMTFNAYAGQMRRRMDDMDRRVAEAEDLVEAANEEVRDAFGELRKVEIAKQRFDEREHIRLGRIEQAQLDEMAQQIHRRKHLDG